jgi:Ca2+-binding RTX toxin-like protein
MAIINGTALANVLNGTAADDQINGLAGNDTLNGLGGNDTLDGGTGNDTMAGGVGNDIYIVDSASDVVTEAANAGTDTVRASVTLSLATRANVENLTLTGAAAINGTGNTLNNIIIGNSANNKLDGGAGNDRLDGGLGNDTLIGGLGNDVLVVNAVGDIVTEAAGGGTDTVESTITFSLAPVALANVENLTLTGAAAINGTGNALNNSIIGNAANNVLSGGAGNDTLNGGLGNDTMAGGIGDDVYVVNVSTDVISEAVSSGTDTVQSAVTYTLAANVENLTLTGAAAINGTGNTLNNVITGNGANNILNGGSGNDTLNGGLGNDTLIGGLGNDIFVVNVTTDIVTEAVNAGIDTIQSAVTFSLAPAALANVENLTLTGSAVSGTGNALNNVIIGNALNNTLNGGTGNDRLDGGLGNDTLIGGTGNDVLVVNVASDVVTEAAGGGTDTVESGAISLNLALAMFANVENATLTGNGTLNLTGNGLANVLTGNSGSNVLNGGAGIDTMIGGLGNDTYVVDSIFETVTEAAGAGTGTDTVQTAIDYQLGANLENLTLTGTAAVDGTGNLLDNVITGNSNENVLTGRAGNDTLNGMAGDDVLIGGAGDDTLNGGEGEDNLLGQNGDDTLVWDETDAIVNGGVGEDTLAFGVGEQVLELPGYAGTLIQGIEGIDMRNGAEDTLLLNPEAVLDLSWTSDTVRIEGDAGDTIYANEHWKFDSVIDIGGNDYAVLTNGDATLHVRGFAGIDFDAPNDAATGSATAVLDGGFEDTAYTIHRDDLLEGFSDPDGDMLFVDDLTAGNGMLVDNNDGTWTFTPDENFSGTVSLDYTVEDGFGDGVGASQQFELAGVADAPGLSVLDATGTEDNEITLNISGSLTDGSETLGFTISGVPEGATFSAGTDNGDGSWTFALEDLAELTITPPADSEASFDLTVTAVSTDGTSTAESDPQVIHVTVVPQDEEVPTLEGTAVDGYIAGATVFADTNENGQLDAGEAWTMTGGSGQFSLVGGNGPLVLFGGTDISTGLPFDATLTAPEGFTVITPLTTLITAIMEDGAVDAATAESQLEMALGLANVDLTTFDPIAAALDDDMANDADALAVFAAGVQVYNAVALASSLLAGTGEVSGDDATAAVIATIVQAIGENGTIDLSSAEEMETLISDAAAGLETPVDVTATVAGAGAIIAATNTVIDDAISAPATNLDALTQVAQVAVVVNSDDGAADALENAGDTGDTTAAEAAFTGANLDTAVDDAADDVGAVGGAITGTNGNDGDLVGTAGNDVIDGLGGNDFLAGQEGNDLLFGGAGRDNLDAGEGDDQLFGGAGDDFLTGYLGNDLLDGGENPANQLHDFDTANYALNDEIDGATGVNVNLATSTADDGLGGTDTLMNIEKVVGTKFNDVLTGGNVANLNSNRAETFEGRGGDDTITGGSDLQNGSYSVNYAHATSGVFINLGSGDVHFGDTTILAGTAYSEDDGEGLDTLTNINRVRGSEFGDYIFGRDNSAQNVGVERFQAGGGADQIDGGLGIDYVQYQDAPGAVSVTFYDPDTFGSGFGNADDGYGYTDVFINIEGVRGSAFGDTLTGNEENQRFEGMAGNDGVDRVEFGQSATGVIVNLSDLTVGVGQQIISGNTAFDGFGTVDSLSEIEQATGSRFNDTIIGTNSDNRIDGGLGVDTVTYHDASGGVTVNLNISGGQDTGGGGFDTLLNIENVRGSSSSDLLIGNAGANRLDGRGGNDRLVGGAGNDILDGGENSSNVVPDADTADYSGSASGVTVNLGTGIAENDGFGGTDTLISIERVVGTDFYDDNLTAGDASNLGTGNSEQLEGRGGSDILTGGAIIDGYQTFAIYANDDAGVRVNIGESDIDLADFGESGVLEAGTAWDGFGGIDTLIEINRVRGSDFDDMLFGGASPLGNERFEGMAGNDIIDGGAGIDYIHYSSNSPTYGSPASGVTVTFDVNGNGTVADDRFGGTDQFFNIEGVRGSNNDDILTGSNRTDVVERFEGMGGNDSINGGSTALNDLDRVEYGQSTGGVNVNLATGIAFDGLGGADTLSNIEQVTGSRFADTLTGDTGDNLLNGSGGNDTLIGGAGNDTLDGGENISDLLADSDTVNYKVTGAGSVTVNLTTGTASDGLGGTDTLISIERVFGTDSADNLTGGDTANIGTGKSEQFEGRGGNDIITGGSIAAGFTTFAMYTNDTSGIKVNLDIVSHTLGGVSVAAGTARDGFGGTDTLVNINRIRGSNHADFMQGGGSPDGGNERFEGLAGNDFINGGAGFDYLMYQSGNPTTGVTVDLGISGTAGNGTVANDGFGNTDTFFGIEGVRGSSHADNLIGSDRDDGVIERFEGMGGNDTINGNDGLDRVEYGQSENSINVNLALGTALDGWGAVDTLSDIEQVQGSRLNDTITGDGDSNQLDGSEGNDRIAGGAGGDLLIGGADADTFDWNAGDQGSGDPAVDYIQDFSVGDGDRLDLRDLLVGENGSNLDQYLDFNYNGTTTFIDIRSTGLSGIFDQQIALSDVDLTEGSTLSDATIINNLLSSGSLLADGVI